MIDLRGKVAIVTGAGRERGIGRGIAVRLARAGANVAVSDLCRRGAPDEAYEQQAWRSLQESARAVEEAGSESLPIRADVSNAEEIEAMVAATVERFGRVDILVNNAGLGVVKPALELTEAEFRLSLDVMTLGPFLCALAVGKRLFAQGQGGRIINIASVHGLIGSPLQTAYCAAKFGVIGLTKSLALEWAPHGITVNAVCPGVINTQMYTDLTRERSVVRDIPEEEIVRRVTASVPAGRLGTPDDIANAVAFLASDESSYITGHSMVVDGGWPG